MVDPVPTPPRASLNADLLLNKAVQDMADGKFSDALSQLSRAAELYDEDRDTLGKAMACYNLGVAALNTGESDAAFGWFTTATRLFTASGWPAGASLSQVSTDGTSMVVDVDKPDQPPK